MTNATAVGSTVKRNAARLAALALILALYGMAKQPQPSPEDRAALASRFRFTSLPLPELAGQPHAFIRPVNPSLDHISAWISSVGAGIALNELDGDGLPNDLCLVETRTNQVVVAPVPGTSDRYAPFTLDPAPLPYDSETTAPMGCLPGDVNEDGRVDIVVYYWGRSPIVFLRGDSGYVPQEIVPNGGRWYTNAATFSDLNGDGHADLIVGNYFQDEARILDARAAETESMQASMSRARNAGTNRILLWAGSTHGSIPSVRFEEAGGALDEKTARAWTLAVGAADLDGDLLPEIYFANDFGPDRLLHNRTAGRALRLATVEGKETLTTPSSSALGRDSFKGMGVDFGDLNGDGLLDIYVSNIAAEYALLESHFAFLSTGKTALLGEGIAPYVNSSERLGLSRSSWAWESRLSDFDNDGVLEAQQAIGFVKGTVNRWPELQELAMGNDGRLSDPQSWPRFRPGDDLCGHEPNTFFVRGPGGRYIDIARELGIDDALTGRGIATADVDGDGDLDFAIANQWAPSRFYRNDAPDPGAYVGLHLLLPLEPGKPARTAVRPGHPGSDTPGRAAIGASVKILLDDGRELVAQVDGGNGHSGKRSHDIHIGLGSYAPETALTAEISWRDPAGVTCRERLLLRPGWHTVLLGWPAGGGSSS